MKAAKMLINTPLCVQKIIFPIFVSASIIDLRVDICWQHPGRHSHSYALGKIYMKIEWGLLSGEGGKTVSKLYSEGGADSETAIPTRELFGRAFRQDRHGNEHGRAGHQIGVRHAPADTADAAR